MFENYDVIVIVCTDRGNEIHGRQEIAELRPDRGRPDLIAMGKDPATIPRAEFGFFANESVTTVKADGSTHITKRRAVPIRKHNDGRVFVHLPHHPGCDRRDRIEAGWLFTRSTVLAQLRHTRSVVIDVSRDCP